MLPYPLLFSSLYASTVLEWVEDRSKARKPVSVPEILDAVFSITLTPSPTSWRRVFRAVVHKDGVKLTGRMLPHYQHLIPLSGQFMLKAIEMNSGSVGGGSWRRFQPSLNHDVELELILNSLKNLSSIVDEINASTTDLREKSLSNPSDGLDDELAELSRKAVRAMKKNVANGGLHGVGELLGHHVLATLALLGIVTDSVHSANASISQGTDTARFLASQYSISTPSHFKATMRYLSSQSFGDHGKLPPQIIENLICELGRSMKDSLADRCDDEYLWCDVALRSMLLFDVRGDDGKVVAKRAGAGDPGLVTLRVVSHLLSATDERKQAKAWKESLSDSDRSVSFLMLDKPRPRKASIRDPFVVGQYPWWDESWDFSDVDVDIPILAVRDPAAKKKHAKRVGICFVVAICLADTGLCYLHLHRKPS